MPVKRCRSCRRQLPKPFLDLGNMPLSNAYVSGKDLHKPETYYPLVVYCCPRCHLVQLDEFETPEHIFSEDYVYFSSYSSSWLDHCKSYVDMMVKRFVLDKKSLVMEIGSNDGYLLQHFKKYRIPVIGVEPSLNAAKVAIGKGIPTDTLFFTTRYAKSMTKTLHQADLILGNNVLAHTPDPNDFVRGLRIALKPKGVITMEFPHLLNLIRYNQFDTIYQEHYTYLSLHAVQYLFKAHGLEIFDVDQLPTHGGSLRIYARHKSNNPAPTPRVDKLLEEEWKAGLCGGTVYWNFKGEVERTKRSLLDCLIKIKEGGETIVGYGAPAKGNTLLNYCGIRMDFLKYTVDMNPYKQGLFLPGTHIPILHPDQIKVDKPEYILILPWNLKEEIMEQLSFVKGWGGKFIIPIPEVKVIECQ